MTNTRTTDTIATYAARTATDVDLAGSELYCWFANERDARIFGDAVEIAVEIGIVRADVTQSYGDHSLVVVSGLSATGERTSQTLLACLEHFKPCVVEAYEDAIRFGFRTHKGLDETFFVVTMDEETVFWNTGKTISHVGPRQFESYLLTEIETHATLAAAFRAA